jgi:hypothetical protein
MQSPLFQQLIQSDFHQNGRPVNLNIAHAKRNMQSPPFEQQFQSDFHQNAHAGRNMQSPLFQQLIQSDFHQNGRPVNLNIAHAKRNMQSPPFEQQFQSDFHQNAHAGRNMQFPPFQKPFQPTGKMVKLMDMYNAFTLQDTGEMMPFVVFINAYNKNQSQFKCFKEMLTNLEIEKHLESLDENLIQPVEKNLLDLLKTMDTSSNGFAFIVMILVFALPQIPTTGELMIMLYIIPFFRYKPPKDEISRDLSGFKFKTMEKKYSIRGLLPQISNHLQYTFQCIGIQLIDLDKFSMTLKATQNLVTRKLESDAWLNGKASKSTKDENLSLELVVGEFANALKDTEFQKTLLAMLNSNFKWKVELCIEEIPSVLAQLRSFVVIRMQNGSRFSSSLHWTLSCIRFRPWMVNASPDSYEVLCYN